MNPTNQERADKVRQREANEHDLDDSELALSEIGGPWYDQYIEKQDD